MKQMADDFGLLAAELRRVLGEGGPMPRRTVLRNLKRYDLEEVGPPCIPATPLYCASQKAALVHSAPVELQ